jgi:hypothetical protein
MASVAQEGSSKSNSLTPTGETVLKFSEDVAEEGPREVLGL